MGVIERFKVCKLYDIFAKVMVTNDSKTFVVAFNIVARNVVVAHCDHGEQHFYSSVNNVERVKQKLFCRFVIIFMFSFTYDGIFEKKSRQLGIT